ncbi:hypothetical protein RFI_03703 [Reticulomyxa filosa]|uniref:Sugar phosphate transporter domain-containing protein n=1 Tax=Reticulomyxa filosa TaxID=46433 RepID=X6P4F3_RETFI|nr:hypothetical protein RFI_03703 [Reticulomyxa filosa]|eukprot:ETO33400.1 hypothetical protein RFI_03703 [Reticulomyxa filosa]
MICSSLMLIINKLAVHHLTAPSLVLFSQLFTSALCCYILGTLKIIEVDHLEMPKIKPYILVAIVFLGTSWITLFGLIVGAFLYMYTDQGYDIHGYTFVLLWYLGIELTKINKQKRRKQMYIFVFCVDQLYIKFVCDAIPMKTNWGRVYYCNLLSSIPLLVIGVTTGEMASIKSTTYTGFGFLILSCCLGLGMSYFAFLARHLTSAATFTVLGNVCKILTVIVNFLIWDKHANTVGVACLLFCLFCAYHYEQASLRLVVPKSSNKTTDSIDIENDNANHKFLLSIKKICFIFNLTGKALHHQKKETI